jgi:hypothetical protein
VALWAAQLADEVMMHVGVTWLRARRELLLLLLLLQTH